MKKIIIILITIILSFSVTGCESREEREKREAEEEASKAIEKYEKSLDELEDLQRQLDAVNKKLEKANE